MHTTKHFNRRKEVLMTTGGAKQVVWHFMVACAPLTEGWYLLRMQNFCFVLVVIHGAVGSAAPKGGTKNSIRRLDSTSTQFKTCGEPRHDRPHLVILPFVITTDGQNQQESHILSWVHVKAARLTSTNTEGIKVEFKSARPSPLLKVNDACITCLMFFTMMNTQEFEKQSHVTDVIFTYVKLYPVIWDGILLTAAAGKHTYGHVQVGQQHRRIRAFLLFAYKTVPSEFLSIKPQQKYLMNGP
ncbi:hypothetical protein Anapl_18012 [Anas platyrhynchos]|uniref:Uncharacterized protein n=1 Tax=Anas platyrhynchos TaxID=8839 RepID=R0JBN6_ANAPL|nr:hypothetical protein Anapl_18012 [Anas platyrhynchos]